METSTDNTEDFVPMNTLGARKAATEQVSTASASMLLRWLSIQRPYSQGRNGTTVDKAANQIVAVVLASMILAFLLMIVFGSIFRLGGEDVLWKNAAGIAFNAMSGLGVIGALVYPGATAFRFKHRKKDRLIHIVGAFGHQMNQVDRLASHPIAMLRQVKRFHAMYPVGVQNGLGSIFGESWMTITGLLGILTLAKTFIDVFSIHVGSSSPGWLETVAVLLVAGLLIAAWIVRNGHSNLAKYQQMLLVEAITRILRADEDMVPSDESAAS